MPQEFAFSVMIHFEALNLFLRAIIFDVGVEEFANEFIKAYEEMKSQE